MFAAFPAGKGGQEDRVGVGEEVSIEGSKPFAFVPDASGSRLKETSFQLISGSLSLSLEGGRIS